MRALRVFAQFACLPACLFAGWLACSFFGNVMYEAMMTTSSASSKIYRPPPLSSKASKRAKQTETSKQTLCQFRIRALTSSTLFSTRNLASSCYTLFLFRIRSLGRTFSLSHPHFCSLTLAPSVVVPFLFYYYCYFRGLTPRTPATKVNNRVCVCVHIHAGACKMP